MDTQKTTVKITSATLPFPPSTNRYWRNFRGHMVVSKEAREYKAVVAGIFLQQSMDGGLNDSDEIVIDLVVYRPEKRRDLDNCVKILLDSMQGFVYKDDKQIVEIHAYREDDKHNPRVEVAIYRRTNGA